MAYNSTPSQTPSTTPPTISILRQIWLRLCTKSQQTQTSAPSSHIEGLPTELALEIINHLPPSSEISLSYTCRKLRPLLPAQINHIFAPRTRAGKETRAGSEDPSDWFTFLCMLERDHRLSARLVCSACSRCYHSLRFSLFARQQDPFERQCIKHEGKFWLYPHKFWSYSKVSRLQELQQTYNGMLASVVCLDNGLERFQDTCQCLDKVVIRGRYIRLWRPAIVSARGAEDDLQRSVRERRFPICPHSVRPAEVRKVVEYVTTQGGRLSMPFRRNFRGRVISAVSLPIMRRRDHRMVGSCSESLSSGG
jgi:hypothetical protein